MINKLIGFKLIDLNEKGFTVRNGWDDKHFVFIRDDADENGFNTLKTELLISDSELKNEPMITRIKYDRSICDGDALYITFLGVDLKVSEAIKKLGTIKSYTCSEDGWCYGASQSVRCVETSEEEILTEW